MRDVCTLLERSRTSGSSTGERSSSSTAARETDPKLVDDFARDVVLLKYVGMNPVVVHGRRPRHQRPTWSAEDAGQSSRACA